MALRAFAQNGLVATSHKTSRRVKPFQPHPAGRVQQLVPRAAAPEAEAETEDFSFNLSDAKKGNEYSPSDVQAALQYYEGEAPAPPSYNDEFVANPLGIEDASFFDDIDNNEAYEADEYVVAGIPEAAPKKRRDGRRGEAGDEDEDDDVQQAKALDRVKEMEDRMVLEAALEEEFGDAKQSSTEGDADASRLAVWDWLTDFADADAAVDGLEEARSATRKRTDAALISDNEVAGDLGRINPDVFEQPDVPYYLELFSADNLTEEVLANASAAGDNEAAPNSTITPEDISRLDSLAATKIPAYASTGKAPSAEGVARLAEEPELDKAVVDSYIETLRNAVSARKSGQGATMDQIKAMFADEPVTAEAADAAEDVNEYNQLLAAKEPEVQPLSIDLEAQVAAIESTEGEPDEEDDENLEKELRALASIETLRPEDIPGDQDLEIIESYVTSAEDFLASEENRRQEIARMVARGELPADALADDLEDLPDVHDELLAEDALVEEEDLPDVAADEEENDGEQWVERIIELTRVTKVVKGGKIMGFRCVAIVGNQNGLVGVGCQAGREVAVAVKRTLVDAKKNVVRVPLVGAGTLPHKAEAKYHAARCVVVPASDGTGCIAGGSIRSVLELAGVKNCLAKRIGSRSALNSARATIKALQSLQTLNEAAKSRGLPMEQLLLTQ